MPVTIPGRAIGSTKRSEIASRPKNFARASAAAASVPSTMASAVDTSATRMERPERRPDIGAVPGDAEPTQRISRRREFEAAVLVAERVEDDEGERQMQKRETRRCAEPQAERRPLFRLSLVG